ncbi:hypothetical protein UFOVP1174_27 [uncultured Caudovirales phage]|uniref:Uncharacterized protein n=1 Tax=uncultured Caudovirales phage TaxID=2100421 RepID=A0A6J5QUP7_9CAUD|nr:hypothetical protein UFOVP1174_27 [uncultured Caudovirales phage]
MNTLSARTTRVAALGRAIRVFWLTAYGVWFAASCATCKFVRGVADVCVAEVLAVDAIVIHACYSLINDK